MAHLTSSPIAFLEAFAATRGSAILRTNDLHAARQAMQAAVDGGMRIIEFTLTTPGAIELIREFSSKHNLIVGAGTVLTPEEAREAVAAGASFLVSPVLDPVVVAEAHRLNIAVMPGCATPTEMLAAHRMGAQLQKLFPAPGTGALWVQQVKAPLPMLNIVPTAGVTLDNAQSYLKAGSFAVGFVSSLFDHTDITTGRFDAIKARAAAIIKALQS